MSVSPDLYRKPLLAMHVSGDLYKNRRFLYTLKQR